MTEEEDLIHVKALIEILVKTANEYGREHRMEPARAGDALVAAALTFVVRGAPDGTTIESVRKHVLESINSSELYIRESN